MFIGIIMKQHKHYMNSNLNLSEFFNNINIKLPSILNTAPTDVENDKTLFFYTHT